jgi:peptide/nickel transport system substrate-binding protein
MRFHSVARGACTAFGLLAVLGGCGTHESAAGGGTVIIGSAQDPKSLYPPQTDLSTAIQVTELLFQRLADRGPSLNTLGDSGYVPRLAKSWDWSRDSMQITFHLDPLARWQDGKSVTAEDVRFAFLVNTDKASTSRYGADLRGALDSISVRDSVTCTAWYRQRSPEQFDAVVATLTPLPAHLLRDSWHDSLAVEAFSRAPIGNGPFRLVKWEPEVRLELAPSDSYAGTRPALDRVIWAFAPDPSTLFKQLGAGESDFLEGVQPDDANAASKLPGLRVIRLGSYAYNFLQFNLFDGATNKPHPLFADRNLRRALTMALDRPLLVRSVFDSLGRVNLGPYVRAQWAADTTVKQIAFDRAGAARILDSLGWKAGPDGMRSRGGRALAFSLQVPTSSKPRQSFAVLIQEQLRQVGVRVDVQKLEFPAFRENAMKHRFDATMSGLSSSPSPSGVKQVWTSAQATEGGFNYGRYISAAFDAQVDSAVSAVNKAVAKAHYRAAYQIIADDAPAIWLYEPPVLAAASTRIVTGDVRPDAWWRGLATWSIAPGKRIPRDAAPAKTP